MNNQKQQYKNDKGYSKNNRKSPTVQGGRVPPQARELEEAILGAILLEGKPVFDLANDIFQATNCFYAPQNILLWDALVEISDKGLPIDLLVVTEELRKSEQLELLGGAYSLTKISMSVVSSANVEAHCRIIQEKYLARELISICNNANNAAYEDDVFDVLQYAEDSIFDLSIGKIGGDFRTISSIADERVDRLIRQAEDPKALTGVPTGFPTLDRITGGWQPSDLIILAARPGLGKTALALNFAQSSAQSGIGVGIFTLEMSYSQLFDRQLSMHSQVNLKLIKTGDLTTSQMEQVLAAAGDIKKLPIYIDDEGAISLYNLRTKARKMKSKHDIGLLIVDYLQLMTNPASKGNREQEIASISQGLKALAKSLNIPVIALSQLSRAVETRGGNKKPQLSDLRESGSIEQDANMVLFLSREDYEKTGSEIDPALANTAELRIAKNRDGELKEIALDTHLQTQRFFEPVFIPVDEAPFNPYAGMPKANPDRWIESNKTDADAPF